MKKKASYESQPKSNENDTYFLKHEFGFEHSICSINRDAAKKPVPVCFFFFF